MARPEGRNRRSQTLTDHIPAGATGRWGFTTASGARYVLDLDAMTATRLRDDVEPDWTVLHPLDRLRRDGETVPLLAFEPISVGADAYLLLQGLNEDPGVSTSRRTTPVVALRRLPADDGVVPE